MTVSVTGAELFSSTRGEGPVCLVPHMIGTKPLERLTPPQLSDRFRLVYVDLRGSGRSTGDPGDLTFDVLADDLEAVRVDLGVERIAVLGYSILGVLAIEYGRRCPGSVSHVIAVGTPPRGDVTWLAAEQRRFFDEDASEDRKLVLQNNLAKMPPSQAMLAQTPMRFFDARFDAAPLFAEADVKPAALAHLLGPLTRDWDVTVGSSAFCVPLFIAQGRYDYIVPHVLWDGIVDTLPGATFRLFERSGHQPFFEEPDEFVAALTDWMSSKR